MLRKKPDLQRSGGWEARAVRRGQCWGRGQDRWTHSQWGSVLATVRGAGLTPTAMGTCWKVWRRKMMKPDSVLKRPLCPVDRKLTMVEARMELGDQGRRLLGSPRQKLVVTSAQVWAMDGKRAWHLEHSPPRTCWPIQCGGHQISPKLARHIGTQSQVDTLTGV